MDDADNSDIGSSAATFPRKALVIPGLIPLAVLGFIFGVEALGASLNPHGISGIVILLVMIYGFGAASFELLIISRALKQLGRSPMLRTTDNLLAVLFAVLFVIAMLWLGFRALLG